MSFPRLCPAVGAYKPKAVISDKNLIKTIYAVRLFINRWALQKRRQDRAPKSAVMLKKENALTGNLK
ncbi:hypothetical protein ATZ36_15815 [Candidatus Endomicrobiellum trichonymphae]|uniref:Uncharacterized protein n=1 Tax=Endomicrobium trichonymphae TaxID=1408204 RepID=A0A1E5ILA5_ENDTX|nr:hypothetical protein ATZ36_15815 [Candidatus Endomicrobium trichonymphae]